LLINKFSAWKALIVGRPSNAESKYATIGPLAKKCMSKEAVEDVT
jgi:hypothetical protein